MDIAITGASGFIGRPLVAALRARGDRVREIGRNATGPDGFRWDPSAGTIDDAAFAGADAVVHLAGEGIGEKKWSPEQKARILDSRVQGTELVATTLAAMDARPTVLVSSSAIGYYGDRGDEVLTEASAAGAGFLAEVCTRWEDATKPAADAGVRVVQVRTGIVLSPDGGALARMLLPFKLGFGGRIGSGQQWMSWISLDDEVRAIIHAIDHDLHGPVNLTAPNPVTNDEFTATLGRVLGRPTVLPTPLLPLRLRYGAELVQHLLLDSARVEPTVLARAGFEFGTAELEAALRNILRRA